MSGKLPVLKAALVVRALQRGGFVLIRQRGSHMIFNHPDRTGLRVTVPDHGPHDIKRKTLTTILKQADLTLDEFQKLL